VKSLNCLNSSKNLPAFYFDAITFSLIYINIVFGVTFTSFAIIQLNLDTILKTNSIIRIECIRFYVFYAHTFLGVFGLLKFEQRTYDRLTQSIMWTVIIFYYFMCARHTDMKVGKKTKTRLSFRRDQNWRNSSVR